MYSFFHFYTFLMKECSPILYFTYFLVHIDSSLQCTTISCTVYTTLSMKITLNVPHIYLLILLKCFFISNHLSTCIFFPDLHSTSLYVFILTSKLPYSRVLVHQQDSGVKAYFCII